MTEEHSMTEEQEIELKTLTAETLGVDPDEITDTTSGKTLSAWSSFNHLVLMSAVEQAYGLTFSMEEMTGIQDYGELRALVGRHL